LIIKFAYFYALATGKKIKNQIYRQGEILSIIDLPLAETKWFWDFAPLTRKEMGGRMNKYK
jgi:hypothetical protein